MADRDPASKMYLTTRKLKYNQAISKIPKICKVDIDDLEEISCMKTNTLTCVKEELFKIIGDLYNVSNLRAKVLDHIKTNWKHYRTIATKYLGSKKLELVIWLVDMLHFDIPADELCLHVCGLLLNIHITVDYHFRHWTTLDVSGTSHDLVASLSDVHLIYMGEGHYSLLGKRKNILPNIKHQTVKKPYSPESMPLITPDTELSEEKVTDTLQTQDDMDITGIYSDITENYDYNGNNTSSDTILYTSDTEIYALKDYIIDTPTRSRAKAKSAKRFIAKNMIKKKTEKLKTNYRRSNKLQDKPYHLFKCPIKICGIQKPTRKELTHHYILKHNILNVCNVCNKGYSMPHSLQQHKYYHKKKICTFTCTRCNTSFPFLSQLKIHRLKHTRKQNFECTECSEPFKYRHDMLKHLNPSAAEN